MKWLLDPGHGGVAFGHYLTPGKRSPQVPPGIYEGAYNRQIADRIVEDISLYDRFDAINIAPGPINIPLENRVKFVNQICKRDTASCALLSLHCNAAGENGWSSAEGFVIFIPRNPSPQHKILAEILHGNYKKYFDYHQVDIKSRGIKEANFTIIKKVVCPSALAEMGFMTNREEVKKLQTEAGQKAIVQANIESMAEFCDYMV